MGCAWLPAESCGTPGRKPTATTPRQVGGTISSQQHTSGIVLNAFAAMPQSKVSTIRLASSGFPCSCYKHAAAGTENNNATGNSRSVYKQRQFSSGNSEPTSNVLFGNFRGWSELCTTRPWIIWHSFQNYHASNNHCKHLVRS